MKIVLYLLALYSVEPLLRLYVAREAVCATGLTRDSPSSGAKNSKLCETQKPAYLGAIFNHSPLELSPPNIMIFHPVFAKFIRLMNEESYTFTAGELDQAYRFIEISTTFYPEEKDQQLALQELTNVHEKFWVTESILLGGSRSANPDGNTCVLCHKLPNKPKAFSSLQELKNKIGEGGCDAADQTDACYACVCSGPNVFSHLTGYGSPC